jgi:hypothetical protein
MTGYHRQIEGTPARFAEAQARTEEALQELARRCESLVCDIGEIASIVLYDVLKREFGWDVGGLERTWQQWNGNPGEAEARASTGLRCRGRHGLCHTRQN